MQNCGLFACAPQGRTRSCHRVRVDALVPRARDCPGMPNLCGTRGSFCAGSHCRGIVHFEGAVPRQLRAAAAVHDVCLPGLAGSRWLEGRSAHAARVPHQCSAASRECLSIGPIATPGAAQPKDGDDRCPGESFAFEPGQAHHRRTGPGPSILCWHSRGRNGTPTGRCHRHHYHHRQRDEAIGRSFGGRQRRRLFLVPRDALGERIAPTRKHSDHLPSAPQKESVATSVVTCRHQATVSGQHTTTNQEPVQWQQYRVDQQAPKDLIVVKIVFWEAFSGSRMTSFHLLFHPNRVLGHCSSLS